MTFLLSNGEAHEPKGASIAGKAPRHGPSDPQKANRVGQVSAGHCCANYRAPLPVDRDCVAFVKSHFEVPASGQTNCWLRGVHPIRWLAMAAIPLPLGRLRDWPF